MNKPKIKIAIIGVGNCASSLVQGIEYYSINKTTEGLINPEINGYKVSDIEVVAAFDIDSRKVGKDLSEAIFAGPNNTTIFQKINKTQVIVKKGKVLDGVSETMTDYFLVDNKQEEVDVIKELKNSGAEMLISYLPVGSKEATIFYANCALESNIGFINSIPEFICSNEKWIKKFKDKGLPCAGDDVKSQVGATIIHRILTRLIQDRGQKITNTYQLNVGGNTDFLNMLNHSRIVSKRKSKTQAILSNLDKGETIDTRIGPSDYVPHLKDNKVCYINIKGKQFADVPFEIDLKLSVEDSPNNAGVMVDVIRYMKIALDRKDSGAIKEVSAYYFKSPKTQMREDVARSKIKNKYK